MRRAITLVEILIVTAIVAILAAITAAVVSSVKARAKTTVCASNQRQIATATLLYVQDYSEVMPVGTGFEPWPVLVEGYTKSKIVTLQCPAYPRGGYVTMGQIAMGIALNGCLVGASSIPATSTTVMLTDVADVKVSPATEFGPVALLWRPDTLAYPAACDELGIQCEVRLPYGATRHQGRGNYTFADTHCKSLPPEALRITKLSKTPCPTADSQVTGSPGGPAFPLLQ